jgi:hypothetical protein
MRLIGRARSTASEFQGTYGVYSVFVFFSDHGTHSSQQRTHCPALSETRLLGDAFPEPGKNFSPSGRSNAPAQRLRHGNPTAFAVSILMIGFNLAAGGLGFYRFAYNGSSKAYVGVMAQEVQDIMPRAVVRGRDGYLRVFYDMVGVKFETYDQWVASGEQVPPGPRVH